MKTKIKSPSLANPVSKKKPSHNSFKLEIDALNNENLKLQRQIFKLKAEQVSLNNIITILKEKKNDSCILHPTPPSECIIKLNEEIERLKASIENDNK